MKAERLLAILTTLLNRERVSAGELARRLEVSPRTILRDMDALAEAGLPVYASPGRDGGFSLVEGFRLDGQLLDTREIREILAGLEGLASAGRERSVATLIGKFSLCLRQSEEKGVRVPRNRTFVELTPSPRARQTVALIESCLARETCLEFSYVDANGTPTERTVEPHALVHVWEGWYLYAWCALRADWRLFKVSRIRHPRETSRPRAGPECDPEARPWRNAWSSEPMEAVSLVADGSLAGRLADFFGDDEITPDADGKVRIETELPVNEWSVSFILGLPGPVRVIRPETLRRAVRERAAAFAEER